MESFSKQLQGYPKRKKRRPREINGYRVGVLFGAIAYILEALLVEIPGRIQGNIRGHTFCFFPGARNKIDFTDPGSAPIPDNPRVYASAGKNLKNSCEMK